MDILSDNWSDFSYRVAQAREAGSEVRILAAPLGEGRFHALVSDPRPGEGEEP